MDTKLTLKLEKVVIEEAKKYAASKNYSLSRLVESYLKSLISESKSKDFKISPFVKSLSAGQSLPVDIDYKKEYREHLANKHS